MKKHIYLIRHGAVVLEDQHKCIGQADTPLSTWGITEAELLRKWYDSAHILPVYSSPLSRCKQTAEMISGYGKKKSLLSFVKDDTLMPLVELDDLKEINMGKWTNLSFSDIRIQYPEEYDARGHDLFDYKVPDGESFQEAGKRFYKVIDQIVRTSEQDVIIVSHAGVIKSFLSMVLHLPFDVLMQMPYPYLGITCLSVDSNHYTLESEWSSYKEENNWILSDYGLGIIRTENFLHRIGQKPIEMLRQTELSHIYSVCHTPKTVIQEMNVISSYIDHLLQLWDVDLESPEAELIRGASLTYRVFSNEPDCIIKSADFIRKIGFAFVAQVIQSSSQTIPFDCPVLTLGELLFYADKKVSGNQFVSLEEKFKNHHPSEENQYLKAKQIEAKIERLY